MPPSSPLSVSSLSLSVPRTWCRRNGKAVKRKPFELTPDILLVVTKKATAQPEKQKKAVAVPVASKPKSAPVVAEKVTVVEEVKKPDSRPNTPLKAVGRSSATES